MLGAPREAPITATLIPLLPKYAHLLPDNLSFPSCGLGLAPTPTPVTAADSDADTGGLSLYGM